MKATKYQKAIEIMDNAILSSTLITDYQDWAIERIEKGLKVSWEEFCKCSENI